MLRRPLTKPDGIDEIERERATLSEFANTGQGPVPRISLSEIKMKMNEERRLLWESRENDRVTASWGWLRHIVGEGRWLILQSTTLDQFIGPYIWGMISPKAMIKKSDASRFRNH